MTSMDSFHEKCVFIVNLVKMLDGIPDSSVTSNCKVFRVILPAEWITIEKITFISTFLDMLDIPYAFEEECRVLVLPSDFKILYEQEHYLENIPDFKLTDATDCGVFN